MAGTHLHQAWHGESPDLATVRTGIVVAVVLVLFAACGPGRSDAPEFTPDLEAELAGRAVERACELHCGELHIYVRDSFLSFTTLVGDEQPMSDLVRTAIAGDLEGVEFVGMEEADLLVGSGGLVDRKQAVLVSVAPPEWLEDDTIGVDVAVGTGWDGFRNETYQFRWNGHRWEAVTDQDTGITVTTSVS